MKSGLNEVQYEQSAPERKIRHVAGAARSDRHVSWKMTPLLTENIDDLSAVEIPHLTKRFMDEAQVELNKICLGYFLP